MTIPHPHAADAKRPVALVDTECYPNFWLLKIRPVGGTTLAYRLYAGQSFDRDVAARIATLFDAYTVITFNGRYYDVPMIAAALAGYTPEQLKWVNDRIIVDKVKPWDMGLPEWRPSDHIDLMEVAPGEGSQKMYAGRIHCKTMRDLPYDPATALTLEQMHEVEAYCENDLDVLGSLFNALRPQLRQRETVGAKYGLDLRSKSDAQMSEAVLKRRCEIALGRTIRKPEIDWNTRFRYRVPDFVSFQSPQLQRALELVRNSIFQLSPNGTVAMPAQLEGLEIVIGNGRYKMGIGGLHSQEARTAHFSDDKYVLKDIDVASYYPNLMVNSGEYPPALGPTFISEFVAIKDERLRAKDLCKAMKAEGLTNTPEYADAEVENEGGKIMINGTFGKTGSPWSILFAPSMLIQTTLTGQLSLLMLIEWHEHYGITVVSANTDGMVVKCARGQQEETSRHLIAEWERRTGLEMEAVEYRAIYSRDVNNYIAIKADGTVKRKGEFAPASLLHKKSPDVEICADAVADYLANGVPLAYTIAMCRDIRKFVTVQRVTGGGVKMWGEGVRKGALVRDMVGTLEANGWQREGRRWIKPDAYGASYTAADAYATCFAPQRPEYLGKVVRWYYGKNSQGPIVSASNGNTVSMSYGGQPCMTLPDEFPDDIDYDWYVLKAKRMLMEIGHDVLQ